MMHLEIRHHDNGQYVIICDGLQFRCAIGKNGLSRDKKEGDLKTPVGRWKLEFGYYRADRWTPPDSALPLTAITQNMGWCDDPAHPSYNTAITLPFSNSHERLWRDDHLYDLILVMDHNRRPAVPGNGSAVFLHFAKPDYSGTEGCIAMSRQDWTSLLPKLEIGTEIIISDGK